MSFEPIYTPPARTSLLNWTYWREASDIDAAVIAFAGTTAEVSGGPIFELRAGGHRIIVAIDRPARAVRVLGIYRAR